MGNIYAQYLQKPKSALDYMADMDARDMQAEQLSAARQRNALSELALGAEREKITRERADRNLLSDLVGQSGGDQNKLVALLRGSASPGLMTQADAIEKGQLERRDKESQIAERGVKAKKEEAETLSRQLDALKFLAAGVMANPTPQTAMSAVDMWERLTGRQATEDRARLAQATTPDQIVQWAQGHAMTADQMLADQRARAQQAETGRHNRQTEANAAGQLRVSQGQLSVAQGNLGVRRDELAHNKSQPRGQFLETPDGYVLADPRNGTNTPVMGPDGKQIRGKSADRALTEGQAKANIFGTRMQEADKILTGIEGKYSPAAVNAKTATERTPLIGGAIGWVGNAMLSEQGQQAEQAQRDFINAVLRRESGAVISPDEFENAKKQYFPQPDDKPATLEQKRRNRQLATRLMLEEVPESKRGKTPTLTSPGARDGGATGDFGGWSYVGPAGGK